MVHTFSDGDKIYSVDMMLAYINTFKPAIETMEIEQLIHNLEYKGWGNPQQNIRYSPLDVISNPDKNKIFRREMEKINNSDLSYPIVVHKDIVIDGIHRLTKAHLKGFTKIKVHNLKTNDIKKFLVDSHGDWNKVDSMQLFEYIQLFYKRFANCSK